jgi:hypothetical protein
MTAAAEMGLATVSSVLRASDIQDLKWFFATGGLGAFRASTMGMMLERAELFAYQARTCHKCGGCGFVPAGKAQSRQLTEYQAWTLGLIGIAANTLPPLADKQCPECRGMGYIARKSPTHNRGAVTARPTGSSVTGGSADAMPEGASLARLGLVSRRLAAVPSAAADALEAYYAPGGGTWVALWHMVPAGKTMLRGNQLKLPPAQFWANRRAEQEQKRDANRERQFREADEQAQGLLEAAARAWNEMLAGAA